MTTASTRKVCVVITARPSYSRIQSALRAIAAHPDLELQLVLAASALLDRYGDLTQTVADDGFQVGGARVHDRGRRKRHHDGEDDRTGA